MRRAGRVRSAAVGLVAMMAEGRLSVPATGTTIGTTIVQTPAA